MEDIEKKARRRIRRFIETGEHQPRVYQIDEKLFEYRVRHHSKSLIFKQDSIGRLRNITT
jgi:hypothetical protein